MELLATGMPSTDHSQSWVSPCSTPTLRVFTSLKTLHLAYPVCFRLAPGQPPPPLNHPPSGPSPKLAQLLFHALFSLVLLPYALALALVLGPVQSSPVPIQVQVPAFVSVVKSPIAFCYATINPDNSHISLIDTGKEEASRPNCGSCSCIYTYVLPFILASNDLNGTCWWHNLLVVPTAGTPGTACIYLLYLSVHPAFLLPRLCTTTALRSAFLSYFFFFFFAHHPFHSPLNRRPDRHLAPALRRSTDPFSGLTQFHLAHPPTRHVSGGRAPFCLRASSSTTRQEGELSPIGQLKRLRRTRLGLKLLVRGSRQEKLLLATLG